MVFQNPDSTLNPAWSTRAILTRAVRKLGGAAAAPCAPRSTSSPPTCASSPVPPSEAQRPLRRSEAAHRHRARLCRRPHAGRLRRACLGPRRVGAGEHPQPARGAADQGAGLVRLHQPRPRGRALHLRPHRRDVPGGAHRGRRAEEVFNPPHHPYTEALLSSIPKLDFDEKRSASPCAARCRASVIRRRAAASTRAATASSATSA